VISVDYRIDGYISVRFAGDTGISVRFAGGAEYPLHPLQKLKLGNAKSQWALEPAKVNSIRFPQIQHYAHGSLKARPGSSHHHRHPIHYGNRTGWCHLQQDKELHNTAPERPATNPLNQKNGEEERKKKKKDIFISVSTQHQIRTRVSVSYRL